MNKKQNNNTTTTEDIIKITQKDFNYKNKDKIRQQKIDKAITNNYDQNNINNISSNRNEPINKKALISMDNKEVIDATIDDITQQLVKSQSSELQNQKNINSYLFNNDNKAFHLELLKRVFKSKPACTEPQDFANSALLYFKECNKFNKMPTLSGTCLYAGVPYSTFQGWIKNPQDLFHPIATTISDYIHDLTPEATIDKNLDTKLFNALSQNFWNYKTGNSTTNIGVIVNSSDKTEEEKQNHINALRLSSQQYNNNTDTTSHQEPFISD